MTDLIEMLEKAECGSPRVIAWFSCGDASAVSTKLAQHQYGQRVTIVRTVIDSEHPDNDRFAGDCEKWFGQPIINIRSEKYASHWDVIEQRRYISGHRGALCTTELKKVPRFAFQRPDDIHVFGYTVEERRRADLFRKVNFEVTLETPLIEASLTKDDCHAIVARQGIELPAMYRLGFNNNNCIGCSKATSPAYWNRIRRHFPEAYDRMARAQRSIDYTQVKVGGVPIFLDELPSDAGQNDVEPDIECSLLCHIADQDVKANSPTGRGE
jgi:hypothetical protein